MVFELSSREAAPFVPALEARATGWLRRGRPGSRAHQPVFRQFSQTLLALAEAEAGAVARPERSS